MKTDLNTNSDNEKDNKDEWQKRCHDCGKFVTKDRWIKVGAPRNASPLCDECYSNYDDPNTI